MAGSKPDSKDKGPRGPKGAAGSPATRVAVVRSSPQSVIADYARVMRLAGDQEHPPAGAHSGKNILKINLSWREWYPAAATAPWQLDGVLQAMSAAGHDTAAASIVAGPGDPAWQREAERLNGLATAAANSGAAFAPLTGDLLAGSRLIHLPVMKTDAQAGLSGAAMSVWEAFHGRQAPPDVSASLPEQIVEALVRQREVCAGTFTVMDGVLAGDGHGPRMSIPYEKGYILAGADPVAVDAVAAHMMGLDPMQIEYIRMATEQGVGQGDLSRIELAGDDISQVNFHFQGAPPDGREPSERYLEFVWYPFQGWERVGRIAETEWGQLMQQYLPAGAELERQGRGKGPVIGLAAAGLVGAAVLLQALTLARRGKRG